MNKAENDDDSEYEEDESLVVVDLSGIMEADLLPKVQECKVLGIDTEKPLLQLDHYAFQGEYEDAMGTCLLFEEKLNPNIDGDGDKPEKELEFKYLTSKKLCMQRVFIKKNTPGLDSAHTGEDSITSEQMDVDVGSSLSPVTSETASSKPGSSSDKTASQAGTSRDSIESPGTSSQSVSQTGSESVTVTNSSASGTIPQTDSDSLVQSSTFSKSKSSVDHSKTEQDASTAASKTRLADIGSLDTRMSGQTYTIEVYTGMDTDDSDGLAGIEVSPSVLDTSTSEVKDQDDSECAEKPNG